MHARSPLIIHYPLSHKMKNLSRADESTDWLRFNNRSTRLLFLISVAGDSGRFAESDGEEDHAQS